MNRHYWKIFAAIVAVQLLLAGLVPITSDEAYFYTWAAHLDVNYYDHPPMVGWLIALFSLAGRQIFFFRLIAIFTGIVVAVGIERVGTRLLAAPQKSRRVSLVYLAAPLHVLFVPISTDTPLFLFTFLCGASFAWGVREEKTAPILLAGFFLSLAILSKYFAGLLLPGLFFWLLFYRPRRLLPWGLVLAAGAAPLILLHLYWNYNDCWRTLMFNVFNRNKDHVLSVASFGEFVVYQLYLATPWVLYYLVRQRKAVVEGIRSDRNPFFALAAVPLALLGLLSFLDTSLHWTLSFYPFAFLLLVYLKTGALDRIIRFSLIFSAVHVLVILVVVLMPIARWPDIPVVGWMAQRYYADIVMGFHGDEIYQRIHEDGGDPVLATPGYTTSALMEYHTGRHFVVFNDDDRNGRNDDKVTDFRRLDGRDFSILSTLPVTAPEKKDYRKYFSDVRIETFTVHGARYRLVKGFGFRYKLYLRRHLKKVLKDCYDIPGYLPVGDCFFYDRYFPDRR
jgi:4-amino-4-deoxy-L-arabinose transferase-like glycosyltransferase